jgi:hypothetical protein
LLYELHVGQCRPQLLRRGEDVSHIDKSRSSHWFSPVVVSSR